MPGKVGTIDPLATQHAAQIGQQKIDDPDSGTCGQKGLGIRKLVPEEGHFAPGV